MAPIVLEKNAFVPVHLFSTSPRHWPPELLSAGNFNFSNHALSKIMKPVTFSMSYLRVHMHLRKDQGVLENLQRRTTKILDKFRYKTYEENYPKQALHLYSSENKTGRFYRNFRLRQNRNVTTAGHQFRGACYVGMGQVCIRGLVQYIGPDSTPWGEGYII